MNLLCRPTGASNRLPDRFCVISMEFLSLSRRRSSSRNVPQRRWARRNVCRAQATFRTTRPWSKTRKRNNSKTRENYLHIQKHMTENNSVKPTGVGNFCPCFTVCQWITFVTSNEETVREFQSLDLTVKISRSLEARSGQNHDNDWFISVMALLAISTVDKCRKGTLANVL